MVLMRTPFKLSASFACVRHGFTLVEVTLAVAIAAVALMGMLAMLTSGLRMGRRSVDDTLVATLAQDVCANLRANAGTGPNWNFRNLSNAVYQTTDYDRESLPSGTPYYRCTAYVTELYESKLARVTLVVVWPNVNAGGGDFSGAPNTNTFYTEIVNLQPY
jgi:prepilin-type N-terminal cleavage/methylation domain-containing protein